MATTVLYTKFPAKLANKEIDWDSDTIKVALVTSSYTPAQDTHDYWDDVSANEVANGNGYTTGGATLGSKTITQDDATNKQTFDAADTSWTASTITARYAVIYNSTPGSGATNPLIGYVDFGSDQSSSSGTFLIQWNAAGIFTTTVS
jgi:hypothetical protein